MKTLVFCGNCRNKEKRDNLVDGDFYCPIAEKDSLPKGIVHYDTDAEECVKKGLYKQYTE